MAHIELDMEALDSEKLAQLDAFIDQYEKPEQNIIAILHYAQSIFKYLSHELQIYIARKTGLPTAKINGIVSFYSFFVEEPAGKYEIAVCMGTACFVKGGEKTLAKIREELELSDTKHITDDGMFSIVEVRCLGACSHAPVVRVNDKIYGHLHEDKIPDFLAKIKAEDAALEEAQGEEAAV